MVCGEHSHNSLTIRNSVPPAPSPLILVGTTTRFTCIEVRSETRPPVPVTARLVDNRSAQEIFLVENFGNKDFNCHLSDGNLTVPGPTRRA